jgi:NAD(P)-dependent dehydrogenase (short-subunit alcohol dehydrogenase family)
MPADIKGKVVLVTGAASGIGRAAALEFGKLGAKVVVATGSNVAGGEETVKMIRDEGGEAVFIQCNVGREKDVEKLIEKTVETYGRLDCAFNNAGIGPDGVRIPYVPLTEVTEENWDRIMDTNLKGVFFCLKYELRQMQKQGKGAIVNTASIGGLKMAPNFGAYGPSKSGVIAVTRTAAIENARAGIRVNVVCPGPTTGTNLMANTLSTNPEEETLLKEHVIPMGKLGTAQDVAHAVVWLCSDFSGHTTGLAFPVDGGMHIA